MNGWLDRATPSYATKLGGQPVGQDPENETLRKALMYLAVAGGLAWIIVKARKK